MTRDPIGYAGGTMNVYEYVFNNPINHVDPLGLGPEDEKIRHSRELTPEEDSLRRSMGQYRGAQDRGKTDLSALHAHWKKYASESEPNFAKWMDTTAQRQYDAAIDAMVGHIPASADRLNAEGQKAAFARKAKESEIAQTALGTKTYDPSYRPSSPTSEAISVGAVVGAAVVAAPAIAASSTAAAAYSYASGKAVAAGSWALTKGKAAVAFLGIVAGRGREAVRGAVEAAPQVATAIRNAAPAKPAVSAFVTRAAPLVNALRYAPASSPTVTAVSDYFGSFAPGAPAMSPAGLSSWVTQKVTDD